MTDVDGDSPKCLRLVEYILKLWNTNLKDFHMGVPLLERWSHLQLRATGWRFHPIATPLPVWDQKCLIKVLQTPNHKSPLSDKSVSGPLSFFDHFCLKMDRKINEVKNGYCECSENTKMKQNCILSTSSSTWHIQTPPQGLHNYQALAYSSRLYLQVVEVSIGDYIVNIYILLCYLQIKLKKKNGYGYVETAALCTYPVMGGPHHH